MSILLRKNLNVKNFLISNFWFDSNTGLFEFDRCIRTNDHTVEIIGRAPAGTYIDCIGGRGDVNSIATERPMYEITDL